MWGTDTAAAPPSGREPLLPKAGALGHTPPGSQDAEAGGGGGDSERQLGLESSLVFLGL